MQDVIRRSPAKLIAGIILVALGILFMLDNFGLAYVPNLWRFWPLILVAVGLSQIRGRFFTGSFGGHVLLALGIVFLLNEFDLVRNPFQLILPFFLVFLGLRIVVGPRGLAPRHDGSPDAPESTLGNFAAFSGIDRKIASQDFRGGDLGAFCGGWDIDLRQAAIAGDEANIDVFVWWGGGDIRVPSDWDVVVKVLPIFGGVGDKTTHPVSSPTTKRLILTGTIVMGGVEVKN